MKTRWLLCVFSLLLLALAGRAVGTGAAGAAVTLAVPPLAPVNTSAALVSCTGSTVCPCNFPGVAGISATIQGAFCTYWHQNGGLPVFGYPLENEISDGGYTVQYFERQRFELHPEKAPPYDVLLGLLGVQRLAQLGRTPEPAESGASPGCQWFGLDLTGHNVCDQEPAASPPRGFKTYWSSNGLLDPLLDAYGRSVALWGYPITTVHSEVSSDGHYYDTQWFQRARLEWHPGGDPNYKVLGGLIGREVHDVLTGISFRVIDRESRPLQASIAIEQNGKVLETVQTDKQGLLRVLLAPGVYTVRPLPAGDLTAPEQQVTVQPGQVTSVTIVYAPAGPPVNVQGSAAAKWARALDYGAAYILYDGDDYSKAAAAPFAATFSAQGGNVLNFKEVPPGTTDFSPYLGDIVQTNADLVYYASSTATGPGLLRAKLVGAAPKIAFMGLDAIVSQEFLTLVGSAAEGTLGTGPAQPTATDVGGYKVVGGKWVWQKNLPP